MLGTEKVLRRSQQRPFFIIIVTQGSGQEKHLLLQKAIPACSGPGTSVTYLRNSSL